MECSPLAAAALASSFPSRIMVLFSRLEHFRASSNASIQHRPENQTRVMEIETTVWAFYSVAEFSEVLSGKHGELKMPKVYKYIKNTKI